MYISTNSRPQSNELGRKVPSVALSSTRTRSSSHPTRSDLISGGSKLAGTTPGPNSLWRGWPRRATWAYGLMEARRCLQMLWIPENCLPKALHQWKRRLAFRQEGFVCSLSQMYIQCLQMDTSGLCKCLELVPRVCYSLIHLESISISASILASNRALYKEEHGP